VNRTRLLVGTAGVLLLAYGGVRLLTQNSWMDKIWIGVWPAAAVVIHDVLLSPTVLAAGRVLTGVPARGRRYLQSFLVVAAAVTAVALPLVHREGTQPPSKALLVRDYGTSGAGLLGLVAAVHLALYAASVVRARRGR
jgi:hypothetical protein